MTTTVRRLARPPRADAGYSLPELATTAALIGIVLAVVMVLFTGTIRSTRVATGKSVSAADARLAMEVLTRRLRVAVSPGGTQPAFGDAGPNAVSFYASVSPAGSSGTPVPRLLEYRVDTAKSCLRETESLGVVSAGVTTWPASTTRCLAWGLPSDAALSFAYYSDGAATNELIPTAGALAAGDLGNVRSVAVTLTVRDEARTEVTPTVLTDAVNLVNLSPTGAS